METNIITVKKCMELLGISRSSLYRLIKLGLPSSRQPGLGRRIYYAQAVKWIEMNGPNLAKEKIKNRKK